VKVNLVGLNQSIYLEPSNLFSTSETSILKSFLSKISNQLSIQLNNKINANEGLSIYNPLKTNFNDTSILNTSTLINNTFYFNRNNSFWGMDYNYMLNQSKQLLTYGLNTIGQSQHL